ncbi:MAG: response regulator [Actinobacteria bacterium]|nr:response regulator [Actinomycetota bacterium]
MLKGLFKKDRPKVLIVDDDGDVRQVVRSMIEAENAFEILEAADGETALDLVYKEQPALIILDYMMPGMTGADAAKGIRTLAPDARIIAFTAVLKSPPDWADIYVDKTDIHKLVPTLRLEADAARK